MTLLTTTPTAYYVYAGGKKPPYYPENVRNWASDLVLFTPSYWGFSGTLLQGSMTLSRSDSAPFFSTLSASAESVYLNCSAPENATTYANMVGAYNDLQRRLNLTIGHLASDVEGTKVYTADDGKLTSSVSVVVRLRLVVLF